MAFFLFLVFGLWFLLICLADEARKHPREKPDLIKTPCKHQEEFLLACKYYKEYSKDPTRTDPQGSAWLQARIDITNQGYSSSIYWGRMSDVHIQRLAPEGTDITQPYSKHSRNHETQLADLRWLDERDLKDAEFTTKEIKKLFLLPMLEGKEYSDEVFEEYKRNYLDPLDKWTYNELMRKCGGVYEIKLCDVYDEEAWNLYCKKMDLEFYKLENEVSDDFNITSDNFDDIMREFFLSHGWYKSACLYGSSYSVSCFDDSLQELYENQKAVEEKNKPQASLLKDEAWSRFGFGNKQ